MAGAATITITHTGQTQTLNEVNGLNDGIQRIRDAYFAKKIVTENNGPLRVSFERINEGILGRQVYLVLETKNMRGLEIDVAIKPSDNKISGGTDALTLKQGSSYHSVFSSKVGDFTALNNSEGKHDHYTNLEILQDKCIVKLQLLPQNAETFKIWGENIGNSNGHLTIQVKRADRQDYAFKNESTEQNGEKIFLQDLPFIVTNKTVYEIYHTENRYKLTDDTASMWLIKNDNSNIIKYFYHDKIDNEHDFGEFLVTTVQRWIKKNQISRTPNDKVELICKNDFAEYNNNGIHINFLQDYSGRDYVNPACMAALMGTMADQNIHDLGFGGFSNSNGDPGVSSSHINGVAGDIRYLRTDRTGGPCLLSEAVFDYDRQVILNESLYRYGFGRTINMLSENFKRNGQVTLLPHTSHYRKKLPDGSLVRHDNHLHMQGFSTSVIQNLIQ